MKLEDLHEMTLRVSSYETIGQSLPHFQTLKDVGTHCGDMEHFNVYKSSRDAFVYYAVFEKDKCVAFFIIKDDNCLDIGYVIPEKRQNGILSMFLFFLKRNENITPIEIGQQQSEQMIAALLKIYKRFNTYWIKDGSKVPFDPNTVDQFYSDVHQTGWSIILENDGDFSSWKKFYDPTDPINKDIIYSCFLET